MFWVVLPPLFARSAGRDDLARQHRDQCADQQGHFVGNFSTVQGDNAEKDRQDQQHHRHVSHQIKADLSAAHAKRALDIGIHAAQPQKCGEKQHVREQKGDHIQGKEAPKDKEDEVVTKIQEGLENDPTLAGVETGVDVATGGSNFDDWAG